MQHQYHGRRRKQKSPWYQCGKVQLIAAGALTFAALNMALNHYWLLKQEVEALKHRPESDELRVLKTVAMAEKEEQRFARATSQANEAEKRAARLLKRAVCRSPSLCRPR